MEQPQAPTSRARTPTLVAVALALLAAAVVAVVLVRVLPDDADDDPDPASPVEARTAAIIPVPGAPTSVTEVAWREESDLVPVTAGAGLVVVHGSRVVGLDGETGETRWWYGESGATPSTVRATPDGRTVLALLTDPVTGTGTGTGTGDRDPVLLSLDALTGEVLFHTDLDGADDQTSSVVRALQADALTDTALMTRGTSEGSATTSGIDVRTGDTGDAVDTAGFCGGPDPLPTVQVAATALVVACWRPDAADRRRDDTRVSSGTLVVVGVDPLDGSMLWETSAQRFRAEARPGGGPDRPKPSARVELSPEGTRAQVSWSVSPARFTRGGRPSLVDLAEGAERPPPGGGTLTVGDLYATDDGRLVDLRDDSTARCPRDPYPSDACFSADDGTAPTAALVGDSWVGTCDPTSDELDHDLSSSSLCVAALRAGARTRFVDLRDLPDTNEVLTRVVPGAVVVTAATLGARGGFTVLGLH